MNQGVHSSASTLVYCNYELVPTLRGPQGVHSTQLTQLRALERYFVKLPELFSIPRSVGYSLQLPRLRNRKFVATCWKCHRQHLLQNHLQLIPKFGMYLRVDTFHKVWICFWRHIPSFKQTRHSWFQHLENKKMTQANENVNSLLDTGQHKQFTKYTWNRLTSGCFSPLHPQINCLLFSFKTQFLPTFSHKILPWKD